MRACPVVARWGVLCLLVLNTPFAAYGENHTGPLTATAPTNGHPVARDGEISPGRFTENSTEAEIEQMLKQWKKDVKVIAERSAAARRAIDKELEPYKKFADDAKARGKQNLAGFYTAAAEYLRKRLEKATGVLDADELDERFTKVYEAALKNNKEWAVKIEAAKKAGLSREIEEAAAKSKKANVEWFDRLTTTTGGPLLRSSTRYRDEIAERIKYTSFPLDERMVDGEKVKLAPNPVKVEQAAAYYRNQHHMMRFLDVHARFMELGGHFSAVMDAKEIERLLEGKDGKPVEIKFEKPGFFSSAPKYDAKTNVLTFRGSTYREGSRWLGQVERATGSSDKEMLDLLFPKKK